MDENEREFDEKQRKENESSIATGVWSSTNIYFKYYDYI